MTRFSFSRKLVALSLSLLPALVGCAADATDGETDDESLSVGSPVHVFVTTKDNDIAEDTALAFENVPAGNQVINVDDSPAARKQDVVGFGASMNDSSAWVLTHALSAGKREAAMKKLFDEKDGIGLSVLRQPIGASDFTKDGDYSFDDTSGDDSLSHFSIAHDEAYVIPRIKDALALRKGDMFVIMSPWSAPAWMKTNHSMHNGGNNGKLRGDVYDVYARYLAEAVKAYDARGVHIDAMTPQNEPGQSTDYPGMDLSAAAEATFVANHLVPAMNHRGLGGVKILGFDYNIVKDGFPEELVSGAASGAFDGLAFHCYFPGNPADLSALHAKHPNKDIFLTECTSGNKDDKHRRAIELMIATMRNWSRTFITWNLALEPNGAPHEGHGCDGCFGAMLVKNGNYELTTDYSDLGHASKFVKKGARVIASDPSVTFKNRRDLSENGLQNVAFRNPDGSRVLVVYNSAEKAETFQVRFKGLSFTATLAAKAAATYTF
jgi:glucosylceramidase